VDTGHSIALVSPLSEDSRVVVRLLAEQVSSAGITQMSSGPRRYSTAYNGEDSEYRKRATRACNSHRLGSS
jgi:hypothetical protein